MPCLSENGKPNDVRVTGDARSSLVIAGLDEGRGLHSSTFRLNISTF
jgi:hypothetical protein